MQASQSILEPQLEICDAHHHLWDIATSEPSAVLKTMPRTRYLLPEILGDIAQGHNITSTIYVEARAFYTADSPPLRQSIGETEFANGVSAMSASGRYGPARVAAGIVARVDLTAGPEVDSLLEAHVRAGGGRVKGIRQTAAFDPSEAIPRNPSSPAAELYRSAAFRSGFARLARFGLSFDAWVFHPQLGDVIDLARRFPGQRIALDHLGTPLGLGPYAGRAAEVFADWKRSICELARCENVFCKLGGLGYTYGGFEFPRRSEPAGPQEIASAWKPFIETAIEAFGAQRCMFESNFPADGISCSYRTLWNTFKLLAADASASERGRLFCGTATHFYGLT